MGVVGRNDSTSPSSTLNGTMRPQASSRNSSAAASESRQFPRRKDREMGRHVSHSRMEFPAQFFHELANRIADVRHQRVA